MKLKIKALSLLLVLSLIFTGQIASAATYYVTNEEEEFIQFNRGMATNKDFSILYENELIGDGNWFEEYQSIQDYANSSYAYFNYEYASWDYEDVPDGDSMRMKIDFRWWGYETEEETEYVYKTIREIIRNNPSITKASDYDKATWAYNWVVNNVKYDYTYKKHSAYSGLTATTVCDGYSKIFYVFATELGLDCLIVSGVADGLGGWGGHAWNLVKMEGDEWYVVDTTWGATGKKDYLLKGNNYIAQSHKINLDVLEYITISETDYINTGNSAQRGSLGSIFGVEFDPLKRYNLAVGEKFTWLINNQDNIELAFTSEDESIATVSKDGIITATGEGKVMLKATNETLGIEQRFTADVQGEYSKSVKAKNISINYGKTASIHLDVTFGEQLDNVEYKSKDKSIATVDKDGKVKGVRAGSTVIEVTYDDGKTLDIKVTVKPVVSKDLEDTIIIAKGNKVSLRGAVKLSKNGYKDLTFKTSNKKVATVSKTGYVTGKGRGECEIKIYDAKTNKKVGTANILVTDYRELDINDLVK